MPIIQLQIRLTSPILAEKKTNAKIRKFEFECDGFLKLRKKDWYDALREAANILEIDKNIDTIQIPDTLISPTIRIYRRTYNKGKTDVFQSIQKNTILSLQLKVSNKETSPTVNELKLLFSMIGDFIGLSEWGNKFGFGRFKVLQIYEVNYDED